MAARMLTGTMQLADTVQMGKLIHPRVNCLWGDCGSVETNCDLPPAGIWRNLDTCVDATEDYNLAPGRYIDSQGNVQVVDPPYATSPVNVKQPPLSGGGRYPGIAWMPHSPYWDTMPQTVPGVTQGVDPDAPAAVVTAPAPAAPADDGLWFGFEPTTVLWIGGGVAAVLLALAYMPAITSGGKN